MPDPSLSVVLERFVAKVQGGKNRLIAIPADKQRKLGLRKQRNNHLLRLSIRKGGAGRWNHHYVKLTYDNELALPADLDHLDPGDLVEVKVHRVIADIPVPIPSAATGAGLLVELAAQAEDDTRKEGGAAHDAFLNAEARRGAVPAVKSAKHGR